MLRTYPPQFIPGAHPKHPNFWKVACTATAERAFEAVPQLIREYDYFLLDTFDNGMHIDLARDSYILEQLKNLLNHKHSIKVFVDKKWQDWGGETVRVIEAIEIAY